RELARRALVAARHQRLHRAREERARLVLEPAFEEEIAELGLERRCARAALGERFADEAGQLHEARGGDEVQDAPAEQARGRTRMLAAASERLARQPGEAARQGVLADAVSCRDLREQLERRAVGDHAE